MKPEINVGEKFSCIALETSQVTEPVCLNDRLIITPKAPLILEDHWKRWLGLQSQKFESSESFLIARAPSTTLDVIDGENRSLDRIARIFFYSSVLHGLRTSNQVLVHLNGSCFPSGCAVRHQATMTFYSAPHSRKRLTSAVMGAVADTTISLLDLYSREDTHQRLKRGFRAWTKAISSLDLDDRLHQFTRSVEALTKSERGEATRRFALRCQTFIGTSEENRLLMRDIYQIRSRIEHMADLKEVIPDKRTSALRVFQTETLAHRVYSHILMSPTLLRHFETENSIDEFWELSDSKKRLAWGEDKLIDLRAEEEEYFR